MSWHLRRRARWVFLAAVAGFAWLSLRGRFDEGGDALRESPVAGVAGALALVVAGLLATGLVWRVLMACLDAPLPLVDGLATFFLGQLGKYVPGSVWSIGAQAELARRHGVPGRATVTAGLVFLGFHVDTAVLLAGATLAGGALDSPWPGWITWLGLTLACAGLTPRVVGFLGRRLGGRAVRIGWAQVLVVTVLMAAAWAAYAGALVLLSPGLPWGRLSVLAGAFAASYAVGVVVVLAPAGAGAREAVFVLLLAPIVGVAPATALALLARVVHTAADGLLAAGWWLAARRSKVGVRGRPATVS